MLGPTTIATLGLSLEFMPECTAERYGKTWSTQGFELTTWGVDLIQKQCIA